MAKQRRLRVFAGPNGSGKSSLYKDFAARADFNLGYFLNADNIEKDLKEKGFINLSELGLEVDKKRFSEFKKNSTLIKKAQKEGYVIDIKFKDNILVNLPKDSNSYEAAFVASFIRQELIFAGKSFSFETVLSHTSKLDEIIIANQQSYKTYLYYVCTESPIVNIARIENRVEKGGHGVEESKIRSRYIASLDLLYDLILNVYRAYIFDNSGKEMRLIGEFYNGEMLKISQKNFPKWYHQFVLQKLEF